MKLLSLFLLAFFELAQAEPTLLEVPQLTVFELNQRIILPANKGSLRLTSFSDDLSTQSEGTFCHLFMDRNPSERVLEKGARVRVGRAWKMESYTRSFTIINGVQVGRGCGEATLVEFTDYNYPRIPAQILSIETGKPYLALFCAEIYEFPWRYSCRRERSPAMGKVKDAVGAYFNIRLDDISAETFSV